MAVLSTYRVQKTIKFILIMRHIIQKSRLLKHAHKDCHNVLKYPQNLDDIAHMTIV
ncbi:MAG: hypothetical protein ETSY1_04995 [Candidatus Entotheonella factor]|uniref:Uncharacterized protein n=1 Tax=Entotheonella factor TaxID=1429438 RepID=W4LVB0_ENTF1|nr:MAG: hypothetical protein ETSY1_04995 [Candidatus Entotheonella factor]